MSTLDSLSDAIAAPSGHVERGRPHGDPSGVVERGRPQGDPSGVVERGRPQGDRD